jgi:hypothetical protein
MQEAIQNEFQRNGLKVTSYQASQHFSAKAYLHARNILDAADLIRLGARAPLVCNLTKIKKATVRSLFRKIRGLPSSPGQAPFTDTWFLKNDLRQLHANLIWYLHQALKQTVRSDARVLIDVYDSYTQIVQLPILNTNSQKSTLAVQCQANCRFAGVIKCALIDCLLKFFDVR